MPQVTVKHRFIHEAPRKVRLVSDTVRGLPADKAIAELATVSKGASLAVRKAIMAGVAAARQQGLNLNRLFISQIMVDEGPRLRRFNMLGRGRSARIIKQMSHLTVSLTDEPVKIASSKVYKAELGVAKPVRSTKKAEKIEEPVVEAPVEAEQAAEGSK